MIKKFKVFENKNTKAYYNVDEYVLIKKGIFKPELSRFGKVVSVYSDPDFYDVRLPDNITLDIPGRFIERYLTLEEIKQYDSEKESLKYNL
jgi:hypothetical protein